MHLILTSSSIKFLVNHAGIPCNTDVYRSHVVQMRLRNGRDFSRERMKMIRGLLNQAGSSSRLTFASYQVTFPYDRDGHGGDAAITVSGRRIQVGDRASRNHVLRSASTRARFTHLPSVLISSWPRAGSLDYPVAIERNTCHVIFDRTHSRTMSKTATDKPGRWKQASATMTRRSGRPGPGPFLSLSFSLSLSLSFSLSIERSALGSSQVGRTSRHSPEVRRIQSSTAFTNTGPRNHRPLLRAAS